jgi:hypothetical protein
VRFRAPLKKEREGEFIMKVSDSGNPKRKIDTILILFQNNMTIKENLRTWIRLVYCKDISGYARRNNKMESVVGKGTSCIT